MLIDVENIDFKRHALFTMVQDVDDIVEPLKPCGIEYFGYARYDSDRGQIYLTNDPFFSEVLFKKKWHLKLFYAPYDKYIEGAYLGDFVKLDPEYMQLYRDQNLGRALFIVRRYSRQTEIFHFYARLGFVEINHLYLNRLDVFEKFIFEFKEKAHQLIQQYEVQRLICLNGQDHYDLTNPRLMTQCKLNQYFLISGQLTKRERLCMDYFKRGYSAKMIARELDISHRTVEHHFAHVREKLGLRALRELLVK